MNTKTEKLTRRGFAFLLALVLTTSAFVPGLTARATEDPMNPVVVNEEETPTLESLEPLTNYETAVVLMTDLDTIAQALAEDASEEDIKAVYDAVMAAQADAEALVDDVALTEEQKTEVAGLATAILTYLTEERGYVPAEPESQNEDDADSTPVCTCPEGTEGHLEACPLYEAPKCTCPEGTEGHLEGCVLYVAPCELCGETGTHKADCATLCTCPEGTEGHVAECPLYICADCGLNKCICSLESAYLLDGAVVYKEQGNAEDTKTITGWNTAVKIQSSITDEDGTVWYQFVYSNVLKELLNGYHFVRAEDTTTLKCTCTPEDGEHAEDCALYVAPSAYELAMEELAALEEEVKTLADGLDTNAEDYIEKLTEKCNDFYDRLIAALNVVADLWDADEITDEEYSAAEAKVMDTLQYLLDAYNYENGEIIPVVYDLGEPFAINGKSGLNINLFDYGTLVNQVDASVFNMNGSRDFSGVNALERYLDENDVNVSDPLASMSTDILLQNGYPSISWPGQTKPGSLEYLFDKTLPHTEHEPYHVDYLDDNDTNDKDTNYSVHRYDVEDGSLFRQSDEGYYYYDSRNNHAYYDYENQKMVVMDYAVTPGVGDGSYLDSRYPRMGHFLPFNGPLDNYEAVTDYIQIAESNGSGTATYYEGKAPQIKPGFGGSAFHKTNSDLYQLNTYDNISLAKRMNMWFGMTVDFKFNQPKDGMINGKPMIYEFSGDDFVWVYVDGVLLLDIFFLDEGTSPHASGLASGGINFKTGEVIVCNTDKYIGDLWAMTKEERDPYVRLDTTLKDLYVAAGKDTSDFVGNTFSNYSDHTFDMFYMEYGTNTSNCYTRFNIEPLPEYGLSISKDVVNDPNPASEFDFYLNVRKHDGLVDEHCTTVSYTKNNGTSGTLTSSSGQHHFKLKDDEKITFSIPHGYTYNVSETRKSNYKTSVDGSEIGKITKLESVAYTNILESGKVNVDKTVTSNSNDLKSFTIKMEANATASVTNIVKPADIVLVLDQSASMYTPMGLSRWENNEEYRPHDNDAKVKAYTGTQLMHEVTLTGKDTAGQTFGDRAQKMAYIVAQSMKPDDGGFYNWYLVEYHPDDATPWYLYKTSDGSSTYPVDSDALIKLATLNDTDYMFYKSQYGALYDSITAFAAELYASGVDHRLAVVGYSGAYYYNERGAKSMGSGVYVGGDFVEYFDHRDTTEPNRGEPYNNLGRIKVEQYQDALVPISQFNTVWEHINEVKTDFFNTDQQTGLRIANNVLKYATKVETDPEDVTRDKVVLLFTDGQPNSDKWKDPAVATAYYTKNEYGAKVYTIFTATASANTDATFLEYISSDHPTAQNTGKPSASTSYSMDVSNASQLVSKFLEVFTQIGGDQISLDENSVLRDTLSGQFTMPAEIVAAWQEKGDAVLKEYIKVYTEEYAGMNQWTNRQPFEAAKISMREVNVTVDGKEQSQYVIDVSNFDYSEHYVTEEPRGKKLIVEFPITASESNKGGNEQATNDYDDSGLYNGEVVVERLPLPHVDTPADVLVKKTVDGNLGDWSKKFPFAASFHRMTDHNDNGTYTEKENTFSNYSEAIVSAVTPEGFELAHGESHVLANLYVGSTLNITETFDGYDVVIKVNGKVLETDPDNHISITVDKDMEIEFVNTKEVTIDTGIALDSIPYIVILVGVAAVVGFLFLRKRRIED